MRASIETPEDQQKVIELYHTGMPLRKIAAELGYDRKSVTRVVKLHGLGTNRTVADLQTLVTYDHVSDDWMLGFVGLFFGEGCVSIHRGKRPSKTQKNYPIYQPQLTLSLRLDDADVIRDIHQKLGGHYRENEQRFQTKPSAHWGLVAIPNIYNLIPHFLNHPIPSKKKKQFAVLLEYCDYRRGLPRRMSDEQLETLGSFYQRIKDLKSY